MGWRIATLSFCADHILAIVIAVRSPHPASSYTVATADVRPYHSISYLQHVQQRRLSGIIESKEQELGVLIEES